MENKTGFISDYGTKQRAMHEGGLLHEAAEKTKQGDIIATRAKAAYPSSLHWYFKKGTISASMLESGRIFSELFYAAQVGRSPQSSLKNMVKVDVSRGTGVWAGEYAEDARRKLNKCYDLLTPLEQNVIRDVAGMDLRASGDKRVLALKTGLRALSVLFKIPVH